MWRWLRNHAGRQPPLNPSPIDAGKNPETLRRHTLRVGEALTGCATIRPKTAASAIVVTLDATFIRSCEDGERHLEVQVGDVETESGGRQVFGAIAKAGTDIKVLICRNLDVAFNLILEQIATLTDDPAITVKGATSLDFIYLAVAESPDNPALQK